MTTSSTPVTASAARSTCSVTISPTISISSGRLPFRPSSSLPRALQPVLPVPEHRASPDRGLEVETLYDAGLWYVGVAGHLIQGKNIATNVGLATITPRKVSTTGGVRLLDRRLILAAQWASFGPNNNVPAGFLPSTGYDLINLYLTWNATKDIASRRRSTIS